MALSNTFRHVPASTLHISKPTHWLTSRFHFSFADHYDPDRMQFGSLRVANDDLVTAGNGFGRHPHRDMNILSYIVDGELSHRDSHGNGETLGRYAVQYMSAGTGVVHEEMNRHPTETVRFLQLWIKPDRKGHQVSYGSREWGRSDRANRLQRIAKPARGDAGDGDKGTNNNNNNNNDTGDDAIPIHQDANVYATELETGFEAPFDLASDRQAYVICIEGNDVEVAEGVRMSERDGLKVRGPAKLNFKGPGHLLMVEMQRGDDDGWQE